MNITMKKYLFIPLLMLLAACQTPEQLAMQRQMQDQADHNTCVGYGFRVKSEGYSNCRLQIDLARQERYNRATYSYGVGYGYGYPHRSHFRYSHWY